jgi:hypothetical protein
MSNLDLLWAFVPSRNAIVTQFKWVQDDPRTAAELVRILTTTPPPPDPITFERKKNPWQVAFDALLSKPENFPHVWPLRYVADDRTFFHIPSVTNLVARTITDAEGVGHILIVNDHPEFENPGPPGSMSYYLFNKDGHFESGGVWTVGYRCFADSAWLDADGRRLWVRVYNNGSQRRDSIFTVEKGQLVRKEFLIEGVPPTDWQLHGLDMGDRIFTAGGA